MVGVIVANSRSLVVSDPPPAAIDLNDSVVSNDLFKFGIDSFSSFDHITGDNVISTGLVAAMDSRCVDKLSTVTLVSCIVSFSVRLKLGAGVCVECVVVTIVVTCSLVGRMSTCDVIVTVLELDVVSLNLVSNSGNKQRDKRRLIILKVSDVQGEYGPVAGTCFCDNEYVLNAIILCSLNTLGHCELDQTTHNNHLVIFQIV